MAQQTTRFVILFQGRTGSTMLIDALKRHPSVDAHGEILQNRAQEIKGWGTPTNPIKRAWRFGRDGFHGTPVEGQVERARECWEQAPSGAQAVGFKTKVRDLLDIEPLKDEIERTGVKVIMMTRANLVKQAVSRVRAMALYEQNQSSGTGGQWNLTDERNRPAASEIPIVEFERMLQLVEYDERVLLATCDYISAPRLDMEYADLLEDRAAWFERIYDFLGVESLELESSFVKNTSDDLRESIANFDQLRSRYEGTRFEEMFDDGAASSN